jgi:hypothetical protein
MPTVVSVVTGQASSHLNANDSFTWVNPTSNAVRLTNCDGFCVDSEYRVPAQDAQGPGQVAAQINANPTNWDFTEDPSSTWNPGGPTPGLPHIQNPPARAENAA